MIEPSASIAAFAAQVENLFVRDRPESFAQCEPAFGALVRSSVVGESIRAALRLLATSPLDKGDWTANQLILHRGPGYALSITLFEQTTRYIHSAPFFGMYAPLGGRSLVYDVYRTPSVYNNAVFDAATRLVPAGSGTVESGKILHIHPDRAIHDFRIDTPQLVLKFTSSAWHVLEWLFDRSSLTAVQANDAALATTQLRVASYLLGRLGHASSIEPLKQLATHRIPNVRWAGIQNLGRLNAAEALAQLRKAVDDEHPHIRRAAQKSLAQAGVAVATPVAEG